jgi:uncharacterized protein YegP (UPF0339 family)
MHFEIYCDAEGEYRWRLRHENSNVIADFGKGYKQMVDCRHGVMVITSLPGTTPVVDMTNQIAAKDNDTPSRW